MSLPDRLKALLDPAAYPHPCEVIRLVETHISWIVLTGNYAYKLKKPVHFNFVDFSTLTRRGYFCREEVRCNRAFAPDLYLGVVAIEERDGRVSVAEAETEGEVAEWAVQMRQFDPEQGLDRLLARDRLSPGLLREFGATLAGRHSGLPRLEAGPEEVSRRIFGPVEDNFQEIGHTGLAGMYSDLLDECLAQARELGGRLEPRFAARIAAGWVRECHGDLHLSNLARVDGTVTAFDCLEFNENLRWIDTMSDVAFLFMDCMVRQRPDCAYEFLDGYLNESADYAGVVLLGYFAAYRSVVRGKVAALRWSQDGGDELEAKFLQHLEWTRGWLNRPPGRLLLTSGLSGSGKSHLAAALVGRLPALRLRSDVARKSLGGLSALADSNSPIDGGLYSREHSDRTFDLLAEVAAALISAGENVIVDATFIERARRDQFVELAASQGAEAHILFCDAPEKVLRERLEKRAAAGADPSEATGAVLDQQLERFEVPGADEPVIRVETGSPLSEARVAALHEALCGEGRQTS